MSAHLWSGVFPAWYAVDQFRAWASRALGPNWSTSSVDVRMLKFGGKDGTPYPMSKRYSSEKLPGGDLFNVLRQAQTEGAEMIAICFDVHTMDAK
jgi:hypothetical protein